MTAATPPAPRTLSTVFGLLMVTTSGIQTHGLALLAAALAGAAVLAGIRFRPVATIAVLFTVTAIALCAPQPVFAALSGLSATAYLALRHTPNSTAVTATQPTIVGALALTFAGLVATAIPVQSPWLPLLAPVTVLASYVIVTQPLLGDRTTRRHWAKLSSATPHDALPRDPSGAAWTPGSP
jgi:hypothetical protein